MSMYPLDGAELQASATAAPPLLPSHDGLRTAGVFMSEGVQSAKVRDDFLSLLKEKNGNIKDAEVIEALERLEQANPTPNSALTGKYLDGEWPQINAFDSPGGLSPDEP